MSSKIQQLQNQLDQQKGKKRKIENKRSGLSINAGNLKNLTYHLSKKINVGYQNFYAYSLSYTDNFERVRITKEYGSIKTLLNDAEKTKYAYNDLIVNGKTQVQNINLVDTLRQFVLTPGYRSMLVTDFDGDLESILHDQSLTTLELTDQDTYEMYVNKCNSFAEKIAPDAQLTVYFIYYLHN